MKRRSVIALIMAATMLAACSAPEERTETKPTDDTVVDTTVQTTQMIFPDVADEGTEQYEKFMEKIEELEAANPGALTYSIERRAYDDHVTYGFVLNVFYSDEIGDYTSYFLTDGEWAEASSGEISHSDYCYSRPYEDIVKLPCLMATRCLVHHESGDQRFTNCYSQEVDSVEDGMYFGKMIAVSEDGTTAYMLVGDPVSFDLDEMSGLSEGDPIGYSDFTVSSVYEDDDSDYIQINLDSDEYGDQMFISTYGDWSGDRMYLRDMSGSFCLGNAVLVRVPIASDCQIDDTYFYYWAESNYDTTLERSDTGVPFLDSYYYAYCVLKDDLEINNGWIFCDISALPMTIEGGELTSFTSSSSGAIG